VSSPIPVSFPDELLEKVRKAARQTHLSQQDVIRQSTMLGMPLLLEQLTGAMQRPKRLSVWDALESGAGLELKVAPLKTKVRKVAL
jgi:hypothetical protein